MSWRGASSPARRSSLRAEEAIDRLARAGGLSLRRAWPRDRNRLVLEYVGDGRIVAGQWDEQRGLRLQRHGEDRRLPGLAALAARPDAALLAHRAGRRATVRAGRAFVKVVPPDRVRRVVAGLEAAAPAVTVPRLLALDPGAGTVTTDAVAGFALHERLPDASADDLRRVGAALRALHAQPAAGPARGPREEAAALRRWLARLRPFAPALHARLAAEVDRAERELHALGDVEPATIHGDLHDKQVFLAPGDVALIDLDTVGPGDPAIDLANLATHLELRALQGHLDPARARVLANTLVDAYGTVDPDRLGVLRRATWLRLACVYAFRPRRPDLPGLLLERSYTRTGGGAIGGSAGPSGPEIARR